MEHPPLQLGHYVRYTAIDKGLKGVANFARNSTKGETGSSFSEIMAKYWSPFELSQYQIR